MVTKRGPRLTDLVGGNRKRPAKIDEPVFHGSVAGPGVASVVNAGSVSGCVAEESKRVFIDFNDLISESGAGGEEDFVIGLFLKHFQSIRLLVKSATTFADADFVFNNIATKIVRTTEDIKLTSTAAE